MKKHYKGTLKPLTPKQAEWDCGVCKYCIDIDLDLQENMYGDGDLCEACKKMVKAMKTRYPDRPFLSHYEELLQKSAGQNRTLTEFLP